MGLVKFWKDCTQDPKTGKYVAKDSFKFTGFYTALAIFVGSAVASAWHISVDTGGALIIIFASIGIQVNKSVESYFARKTADGAGNALVQAGTEIAPVEPVVPVVPIAPTVIVTPTSAPDESELASQAL
ncbi:hypothetical protein Q5H92_13835 [Hymenobacter sp. M29]|uniref:Holin n=1 Tax=Hymenobacter mellowenesis TaxID=3063995 RepID=A0ABT9AEN2_9BACT|nr:hypothetical protein [Hymenobacter sp. M29]MDO7847446.1 hypothetical protein [Hymenobacter sp. M29]